MSDPGVGRTRQSAIYRDGVFGKRPTVPTDAGALEARAQAAMSSTAWAYVAGGAGEGAQVVEGHLLGGDAGTHGLGLRLEDLGRHHGDAHTRALGQVAVLAQPSAKARRQRQAPLVVELAWVRTDEQHRGSPLPLGWRLPREPIPRVARPVVTH